MTFLNGSVTKTFDPLIGERLAALFYIFTFAGLATYRINTDRHAEIGWLVMAAAIFALVGIWRLQIPTTTVITYLDGKPMRWVIGPIFGWTVTTMAFSSAFAMVRGAVRLRTS